MDSEDLVDGENIEGQSMPQTGGLWLKQPSLPTDVPQRSCIVHNRSAGISVSWPSRKPRSHHPIRRIGPHAATLGASRANMHLGGDSVDERRSISGWDMNAVLIDESDPVTTSLQDRDQTPKQSPVEIFSPIQRAATAPLYLGEEPRLPKSRKADDIDAGLRRSRQFLAFLSRLIRGSARAADAAQKQRDLSSEGVSSRDFAYRSMNRENARTVNVNGSSDVRFVEPLVENDHEAAVLGDAGQDEQTATQGSRDNANGRHGHRRRGRLHWWPLWACCLKP